MGMRAALFSILPISAWNWSSHADPLGILGTAALPEMPWAASFFFSRATTLFRSSDCLLRAFLKHARISRRRLPLVLAWGSCSMTGQGMEELFAVRGEHVDHDLPEDLSQEIAILGRLCVRCCQNVIDVRSIGCQFEAKSLGTPDEFLSPEVVAFPARKRHPSRAFHHEINGTANLRQLIDPFAPGMSRELLCRKSLPILESARHPGR